MGVDDPGGLRVTFDLARLKAERVNEENGLAWGSGDEVRLQDAGRHALDVDGARAIGLRLVFGRADVDLGGIDHTCDLHRAWSCADAGAVVELAVSSEGGRCRKRGHDSETGRLGDEGLGRGQAGGEGLLEGCNGGGGIAVAGDLAGDQQLVSGVDLTGAVFADTLSDGDLDDLIFRELDIEGPHAEVGGGWIGGFFDGGLHA